MRWKPPKVVQRVAGSPRRRRALVLFEDAIREVDRFLGLERALRSLQPATNFKLVA